jgi:hypothetical protein
MSKTKISQQNIDSMFKFIFEYSDFEVQGFDEENRILGFPNPGNRVFAVPTRRNCGKITGGLMPKNMNTFYPPAELFYCAKIILGDKQYKKLKKTLETSTFQEILNILKLELWGKYCTCHEDGKFLIECEIDKYEVLKISVDKEDDEDFVQWYDINSDGSARFSNLSNDIKKYPPETFENVYDLALRIIDKKGFVGKFFNKLRHRGCYKFSYLDSLKIYDELLKYY